MIRSDAGPEAQPITGESDAGYRGFGLLLFGDTPQHGSTFTCVRQAVAEQMPISLFVWWACSHENLASIVNWLVSPEYRSLNRPT